MEGIDEFTMTDTTDKDNTHKRATPTITTNTNQWTAQDRTAINRKDMGTHKRATPVTNTDIYQGVGQDTNRTSKDTNKRAT